MKYSYHKHALAETAMVCVNKLLRGILNLRAHNAQISGTYTMIKALNKLTRLDMPSMKAIV